MATKSRALVVAAGSIAAAVAFGCASTPPPKDALSVSEAAVANAQAARAYEFAPVPFQTAQEKLNEARIAMEQEDYAKARVMAEQAEVDANLAYYAARNATAKQSAADLQESIEMLRKELQPGS